MTSDTVYRVEAETVEWGSGTRGEHSSLRGRWLRENEVETGSRLGDVLGLLGPERTEWHSDVRLYDRGRRSPDSCYLEGCSGADLEADR